MELTTPSTDATSTVEPSDEVPSSVEARATPVPASTRVFALPELVENILLHVTPADGLTAGKLDPTPILFVLQRVNTTFKNTISGSKSLQERMCLRLHTDMKQRRSPKDLFEWLLESIVVVNGRVVLVGPADSLGIARALLGVSRLFSRGSHATGSRHYDAVHGSEASWRRMKAHCEESDLKFDMATESDQIMLPSFTRDMTLGEVHDGLQRLIAALNRYFESHPLRRLRIDEG
ncbi:uncharacterized protein RCC_05148 [Ramularia collo-cygni]|uniref:Uncharacterized protein n=1 Tax=Ramularia collo-cygni TaxID=112498 RepID=A0A2D3V1E3_9PEZI|nr:uncharacterized protein RCC_05148 [Ramularia collo-cygni]CZT19300.1 uncharacterized protein RCC_05148 [Ramularia collo-cygni]